MHGHSTVIYNWPRYYHKCCKEKKIRECCLRFKKTNKIKTEYNIETLGHDSNKVTINLFKTIKEIWILSILIHMNIKILNILDRYINCFNVKWYFVAIINSHVGGKHINIVLFKLSCELWRV